MLAFKVAAQYGRGPEQVLAQFAKQEEAKAYIQECLEKDSSLKVNVTYLLYDMGELMDSFDQTHLEGDAGEGGQSQGNTNSFRPTPMPTALRPSGLPQSGFHEKDDSDQE